MIFRNPYIIAALAALQLALLSVVYLKGRSDAEGKCLRGKLSDTVAAIEEKETDEETQASAASEADEALRAEIRRLNRRLELTHVETGLACDAPGTGDSVLHAHDQLFEAGLPAGDSSDDAGADTIEAALEGR